MRPSWVGSRAGGAGLDLGGRILHHGAQGFSPRHLTPPARSRRHDDRHRNPDIGADAGTLWPCARGLVSQGLSRCGAAGPVGGRSLCALRCGHGVQSVEQFRYLLLPRQRAGACGLGDEPAGALPFARPRRRARAASAHRLACGARGRGTDLGRSGRCGGGGAGGLAGRSAPAPPRAGRSRAAPGAVARFPGRSGRCAEDPARDGGLGRP